MEKIAGRLTDSLFEDTFLIYYRAGINANLL